MRYILLSLALTLVAFEWPISTSAAPQINTPPPGTGATSLSACARMCINAAANTGCQQQMFVQCIENQACPESSNPAAVLATFGPMCSGAMSAPLPAAIAPNPIPSNLPNPLSSPITVINPNGVNNQQPNPVDSNLNLNVPDNSNPFVLNMYNPWSLYGAPGMDGGYGGYQHDGLQYAPIVTIKELAPLPTTTTTQAIQVPGPATFINPSYPTPTTTLVLPAYDAGSHRLALPGIGMIALYLLMLL